MRSFGLMTHLAAAAVILAARSPQLFADTTCNSLLTSDPTAFFCDDFDRYCTSPPSDPTMPCTPPTTGGKSDGRLRDVWVPTSTNPNGLCGTQFTVEEDTTRLASTPYGGRYPCQANAQLGQQTVDLIPKIRSKFGNEYSTVVGTDASPLVLSFEMNGGNCNTLANCNVHIQYDIGYMELGLDADKGAQTDWIWVGQQYLTNPGHPPEEEDVFCTDCHHLCPSPEFSVKIPWPTLCQSYTARTATPGCPPAQNTIRHALAVGANALLDNDPCHCDIPSDQVPNVARLTFYDGFKWRIIGVNQVRPPEETTPPVYVQDENYTGDFVLGAKYNFVTLTVKTNTVDIELLTKTPATVDLNTPNVRSKVTGILRRYNGAFNKLRGGFGNGCELNSGSYTCAGNVRCINTGDPACDGSGFVFGKQANIAFDNVFTKGGGPDVQTGACCLPNATCVETTQQNCETTLGGKFGGLLSSCANTVCCHVPFADADGDSDVDMTDAAAFQKCYTGTTDPAGMGVSGACKCFDKAVPAGKIDGDDLAAFTNCVTNSPIGPSANVPWLQANTPSCSKCPPPPALAPGCP